MPDFKPRFTATGIGSCPHPDPGRAVGDIVANLDEMPYWPQLPARDPREDMNLMYAPALAPLVEPVTATRGMRAFGELGREAALAAFYERLMGGELESFALDPSWAMGFGEFLAVVGQMPAGRPAWIKGHVTGPLTFAASVKGPDGKALLYDDEVAEALARGLGLAAAAQAGQLAPLGRRLVMFLDEPFLSGYGSAFTPISRQRVIELLAATMEEARARAEMVIGIHCCGNTDWGLLEEAGADIINLDSHGYGQGLLLYPTEVKRLLERGGAVAYGAVPTSEYRGDETALELWEVLRGILTALEAKGLDRDLLADQALVTPACGMGSLDETKARAILELTAQVSQLARREYA